MDKLVSNADESRAPLSEELFTVSEVAAILKLNEQTIRNYIDAGALPALRIGRRVRIRRDVLQRILTDGLRVKDAAP
jgi:excisionase family DNA binding protein